MDPTHQERRRILALLAGLPMAAALPFPARAQGAPLRMGIQTTVWGATALVAEGAKLWEKANAPVTVNKFDSGANARDAMIGGHIDIVSIGASPFVIGAAKTDLVAIGSVAYAGGTLALIAGKKSGIKSVADLKGKKVASQLGSQTDYVFQNKIAPAFGLKQGDFQVVNVKFRDHVSALASGSVDAFAGVEPYPSVAELNDIGVMLTDYTKYDIVPVILATNKKVLASREADLVKFMNGWKAAAKMIKEQPDKAANLVGSFFRGRGYDMKDDVFKQSLTRMDVDPGFRPELKGYLETLAGTLVKTKRLPSAPNIASLLDDRILKKSA